MRIFPSIVILSILFASVNCFADLNLDPELSNPEYFDPSSNPEQVNPLSNPGYPDLSSNILSNEDSGNLVSVLTDTSSTDTADQNGERLIDDQQTPEITDQNGEGPIDDQQNPGPLVFASVDCPPGMTHRKRDDGVCHHRAIQGIEQEDSSATSSEQYPQNLPVFHQEYKFAPKKDPDLCSKRGSGKDNAQVPMCHDGVHGLVKLKSSNAVNLYSGHYCTWESFFALMIFRNKTSKKTSRFKS